MNKAIADREYACSSPKNYASAYLGLSVEVVEAIAYKPITPIMGMVERRYNERNNVDTFSNDIYDLFSWVHASEKWALISGEVRDDSTLDYMHNVIGFVQAFVETGALGVLDLQIIFSSLC